MPGPGFPAVWLTQNVFSPLKDSRLPHKKRQHSQPWDSGWFLYITSRAEWTKPRSWNPESIKNSLLLLFNQLSAFTLEGSPFHCEVGHEEAAQIQSALQCWFLEEEKHWLVCRHTIFQKVCLSTSSLQTMILRTGLLYIWSVKSHPAVHQIVSHGACSPAHWISSTPAYWWPTEGKSTSTF